MTTSAASRIQSSEARASGTGGVSKGSFASRAQSASAHNNASTTGGPSSTSGAKSSQGGGGGGGCSGAKKN